MIRRRYVVRVFRPNEYSPYDVRRFRSMVDAYEFMRVEPPRRGENPEFLIEDRLFKRSRGYRRNADGKLIPGMMFPS